jgi:hypothetical protein
MNWSDAMLFGGGAVAILAAVAWMMVVSARLRAIERAVQSIVDNTNELREIVDLLRSVDGNTSVLGGIGNVFGANDRKKPR